jgi:hypothetical protein
MNGTRTIFAVVLSLVLVLSALPAAGAVSFIREYEAERVDDSGSQGFDMLRDAVTTGDFQTFEKALIQVANSKTAFIDQWWRLLQLKVAICNNHDRIIEIADEIIHDPGASAEEVEWAQGKRDAAVEGKRSQGCPGGPVS